MHRDYHHTHLYDEAADYDEPRWRDTPLPPPEQALVDLTASHFPLWLLLGIISVSHLHSPVHEWQFVVRVKVEGLGDAS